MMTSSTDAPRRRSPPTPSLPTTLLTRPDTLGSLARLYTTSHFGDYAGLTVILLLYIPLALLVTPFHRLFLLSDSHIQYPHASIERVPPLFLLLYSALLPLLSLSLWAFLTHPGAHKTRVTFHGLITSVILTAFVTDILKNAVGRPRPDLLARCKPAVGTPRDVLVDISVCTETDPHLLQDGWRSFPSGHSSLSFAGLGYMSLFLAGQGKVGRPGSGAGLLGVLVAGLPLLGAALIAVSRTEDYRHDVFDVSAGASLGITIAWLSYRRYFPSLRSRRCEMPYPDPAEVAKKAGKRAGRAGGMAGEDKDEESAVGFMIDDEEEEESDEEHEQEGSRVEGRSGRSMTVPALASQRQR